MKTQKVPVKHADSICPKLYPLIRKVIFKGLHKAALNLHYSNSTPSAALVCPCGTGDAHIATANRDIGLWTCSVNRMECGELTPLHFLWFNDQPPASCSSTDIQ